MRMINLVIISTVLILINLFQTKSQSPGVDPDKPIITEIKVLIMNGELFNKTTKQ
uniref:Egg protein P1731 n=1 Tax=Schistosoma japonicum TaxID=6182 RepID=Q6PKV4_SCHJA|nr:egg protein P1731 [Schistosoma japonicum]